MAPQKAWSKKRERQYERIKESAKESGKPEARAEEIAARTVNKTRRKKGETKSGRARTSGTGNPNTKLEQRTKDELENRARQLKIRGRSRMSKDELVSAIRNAG